LQKDVSERENREARIDRPNINVPYIEVVCVENKAISTRWRTGAKSGLNLVEPLPAAGVAAGMDGRTCGEAR